MSKKSQPQPFRINVDSETLNWITQRLQSARIVPDVKQPEGKEWDDGIPGSVMDDLVAYWKNTYDWRSVEAKLNSIYKMFTLDIPEGDEVINLHFVHHRSERADAIPLLFVHGWPGNFTEVENLLSLTNPEDPKHQAFHIVAPSIPGFVFSSSPKAPGFSVPRIGSVLNQLMSKLGYPKYIAQGGDWGSFILRSVAQAFPDSCIGIHLNMLTANRPSPWTHPIAFLRFYLGWFTSDQKKRLDRGVWWLSDEWGYCQIQSTKPQTIAYGLNDSPIGMLSWLFDKMKPLVDPDYVWDPELIITWTMFYLLSGNSWHARIYKEGMPGALPFQNQQIISDKVAFGASCFFYEVGYVPIWWAKASLAKNVIFWKEHSKGGHFASMENGEILKEDIQQFAASLSGGTHRSLRS